MPKLRHTQNAKIRFFLPEASNDRLDYGVDVCIDFNFRGCICRDRLSQYCAVDLSTVGATNGTTKKETKIFKNKRVKFLIFTGGKRWVDDNSQDIQWCRARLNGDYFIFSPGSNTIEDFCLIMKSDHNIISHVSSFGWWAAFLNDHPTSVTVAPTCYHPDIDGFTHREGFYPPRS